MTTFDFFAKCQYLIETSVKIVPPVFPNYHHSYEAILKQCQKSEQGRNEVFAKVFFESHRIKIRRFFFQKSNFHMMIQS